MALLVTDSPMRRQGPIKPGENKEIQCTPLSSLPFLVKHSWLILPYKIRARAQGAEQTETDTIGPNSSPTPFSPDQSPHTQSEQLFGFAAFERGIRPEVFWGGCLVDLIADVVAKGEPLQKKPLWLLFPMTVMLSLVHVSLHQNAV